MWFRPVSGTFRVPPAVPASGSGERNGPKWVITRAEVGRVELCEAVSKRHLLFLAAKTPTAKGVMEGMSKQCQNGRKAFVRSSVIIAIMSDDPCKRRRDLKEKRDTYGG